MLTREIVLKGSDKAIKDDVLRFMQKEYNQRVERLKKAQKYYNKSTTTDNDVKRTKKEFFLIFDELNKIGKEIENYTGESLTLEQIENGFKGVR